MKLHLGCGQRYLNGYVNIDYPLENHTVQLLTKADEYAEIKNLKKGKNEIDEVRLHHVFEHFTRPEACALVTSWSEWLREGGVIHIEVPDFVFTSYSILLSIFNKQRQRVGIRHLFGSQEAHWANHYEGYSRKSLSELLKLNGFKIVKTKRNSWKGTYNIEVIGVRVKDLTLEQKYNNTRIYLSKFLLDETEESLLEVWMGLYSEQLGKTCP